MALAKSVFCARPGGLRCARRPGSRRAHQLHAYAEQRKPEVIVAGGGIGGLVTALALLNKGINVKVLERVKEYKPFGGPIQMAGNAMSTLEAIDPEVGKRVIDNSVITGDRVNGLLDGRTGEWYCRFDTRLPAWRRGLPLTLVISRYVLIDILREALPEGVLDQGREVMDYENEDDGVKVVLSDGSTMKSDVLIAADGIWSKVRNKMKKDGRNPTYSGYTCYTATCNYLPDENDTIGYRVYLGYKQYFVCSDVGNGQTQWYCFRLVEPGQEHEENYRSALLHYYDDWCDTVKNVLEATDRSAIERRDVYDRRPSFNWTDRRVTLLGDAAHAMQPNMGQGGCQAIEDAYKLARELGKADASSYQSINDALKRYQGPRIYRSAAVSGYARMAAMLATFYRHYLGDHPYFIYDFIPGSKQFWREVQKLRLPHPGRVFGQLAMLLTIDQVLNYIQAGHELDPKDRAPYCQVPGQGSVPNRMIPDEEFEMHGPPGFAT